MAKITVYHEQQCYELESRAGCSLLELLQDLPLPMRQACRNGACGVCRCQLILGQVDYGYRQPTALWQKDIDAGFILPCIATVNTDITLKALTLAVDK